MANAMRGDRKLSRLVQRTPQKLTWCLFSKLQGLVLLSVPSVRPISHFFYICLPCSEAVNKLIECQTLTFHSKEVNKFNIGQSTVFDETRPVHSAGILMNSAWILMDLRIEGRFSQLLWWKTLYRLSCPGLCRADFLPGHHSVLQRSCTHVETNGWIMYNHLQSFHTGVRLICKYQGAEKARGRQHRRDPTTSRAHHPTTLSRTDLYGSLVQPRIQTTRQFPTMNQVQGQLRKSINESGLKITHSNKAQLRLSKEVILQDEV